MLFIILIAVSATFLLLGLMSLNTDKMILPESFHGKLRTKKWRKKLHADVAEIERTYVPHYIWIKQMHEETDKALGIKPKSKPKPIEPKPQYLFRDYDNDSYNIEVDQLLDTARVFTAQRGIGQPIARLQQTRRDHTSGSDVQRWVCVRHPHCAMTVNQYDGYPQSLVSLGKQFICPECVNDKPRVKQEHIFKGVFLEEPQYDYVKPSYCFADNGYGTRCTNPKGHTTEHYNNLAGKRWENVPTY